MKKQHKLPPIKLVVNGLFEAAAIDAVELALHDPHFQLVPLSWTRPSTVFRSLQIDDQRIVLYKPSQLMRAVRLAKFFRLAESAICLDFCGPGTARHHASLYAANGLAFVMGSEIPEADQVAFEQIVNSSNRPAVVAPQISARNALNAAAFLWREVQADQGRGHIFCLEDVLREGGGS
ncbi:MAG: hypothetical protein PHS62_00715 [Patescibacteria group bacterium]|nr:hypothetical protein [Patescibacteria group bacterium]